MQFIKKHYEKILFSLVLTLLAVAAGLLSIQAKVEAENIALAVQDITTAAPIPVEPLKFDKFEAGIKRSQNPPTLDLSISNHVFNPVKWVQTPPPDEKLVPLRNGDEVSSQIEVKRRVPLNLTVTFEGITGTGDQLRYGVLIMDPIARPTATTPEKFTVASTNDRPNRKFATKVINGTGADAELGIELKDETEVILFSKSKPYSRVAGYAVELAYKLDPAAISPVLRRKDNEISFGGEKYKIVAINEKEVVLEAISSGKRYIIKDKSP
jgi:hypothetical protein